MEFNNFDPNIKFIYEFIEASINFLDLSVKCQMVNVRPPSDCHRYLHFQSSHPKHTKKLIVYHQTLKVSRADC